jgi:hypothetical protein
VLFDSALPCLGGFGERRRRLWILHELGWFGRLRRLGTGIN